MCKHEVSYDSNNEDFYCVECGEIISENVPGWEKTKENEVKHREVAK